MPRRVAVLFPGQIRSFATCWPSIYKHVIAPFENDGCQVDLFMHLWEYGTSLAEYKQDEAYLTQFKLQNDECTKEYVMEKAKPIKMVCDKWTPEWERKIMEDCRGFEIIEKMDEKGRNYAVSCCGMYYKIMLANKLKIDYELEHNFKYDLVIRARLDFKWNEDVPLIYDMEDNQIAFVADKYARHGCNDKFFMGTSAMMDEMTLLPMHLYDIWESKALPLFEGQEVHKWMIKKMQLEIIKFGSLTTYDKYLASKRNIYKEKEYVVNNCLSDIGFQLCEYFLGELGIGITGIGVAKDDVRLRILSSYEHFKMVNDVENYNGFTRIIYVNGNEGMENAALSKRVSEYIGLEENFPESMKQADFKQCIFVGSTGLNSKEAVKKVCTKIYQKQSVGRTVL